MEQIKIRRVVTPRKAEKNIALLAPKKKFWKRFLTFDSRLFSIIVGLVVAGIFCSGFYALAAFSGVKYAPGAVLDPGCSPSTSNCSVLLPVTYDSATGNVTYSGTSGTSGDVVFSPSGTTGNPAILSDNGILLLGSNTGYYQKLSLDFQSTPGTASLASAGSTSLSYISWGGGVKLPGVYSNTGGTSTVKIDSNGILSSEASSLRYKHNIQPLVDDFSKILSAQPKSFQYNSNNVRDIGYIAEDFNNLGLSDLVIYDNAGKPNGIQYDRIPVYLLEIIKLQQQDIDALKTAQLNSNGTVGSGVIESNDTIAAHAKIALESMGITVQNGIATVKEVDANKATTDIFRMNKMEMVDSATGDIYCTWIKDGEWVNVKSDCSLVDVATATAVPTMASESKQAAQVVQQVVQQAQQIAQQAQQIAQQSDAAVQSAQQAVQSAQQTVQQAQQPSSDGSNTPSSQYSPSEPNGLLQNTGSGLLNGIWQFINWIFGGQ